MKFYTIVVPVDSLIQPKYTVMLKKNRPEDQNGRWNFPGGKVDFGEIPMFSASRELKEETGLEPDIEKFWNLGYIGSRNFKVDLYVVEVDVWKAFSAEDQQVSVLDIDDIIFQGAYPEFEDVTERDFMSNIKTILTHIVSEDFTSRVDKPSISIYYDNTIKEKEWDGCKE